MTAQELKQIHKRFFNSPEEVSVFDDPKIFQRNLRNRKPHQLGARMIWNSLKEGTYIRSIHGKIGSRNI